MPATAKLCQSAEMSPHFLIPPLNPPIIYLILNQCMVWYQFSIRLVRKSAFPLLWDIL